MFLVVLVVVSCCCCLLFVVCLLFAFSSFFLCVFGGCSQIIRQRSGPSMEFRAMLLASKVGRL